MKLTDRAFFLLNLKLFFNIQNLAYSINFYTKHFFVFFIRKNLHNQVNNMAYILKFLLFLYQVQSDFCKNSFNIGIVASCIIQYKVVKLFLKFIFQNYLNNQLYHNLTGVRANNLTQANQSYLTFYIIINIMSDNNDKSNGVAGGLYIKLKMNIAFCLLHYFCQQNFSI